MLRWISNAEMDCQSSIRESQLTDSHRHKTDAIERASMQHSQYLHNLAVR